MESKPCVDSQSILENSIDDGNQLPATVGMGSGWNLLVIQALGQCASRLEEQIMWCSSKQPLPYSDSVK